MSEDEQDVPPVWSERFAAYFTALKLWIEESAYPTLVQGPLRTEQGVTGIPIELAKLQSDLKESSPIPIALVGITGVGKSTLLNALLGEEFLPTGVIGAQTAAFVSIRYAPQWEVTCEYMDQTELTRTFDEACADVDEATETGSPEIKEAAVKKVRALLGLKADANLPPGDQLRLGAPAEICAIVAQRKRRFFADSEWKRELTLHAKGRYWPITRTIDVRGPFEMLRSGVVISDLPGAGDLNRARAQQAAAAIKDAGQILIATDSRLFQTSLMEQLESEARLPHRLLKEKIQVVLVGTSLDSKVPDPDGDREEVKQLGVDPDTASKCDVFNALCAEWTKAIEPQFAEWLKVKAETVLSEASAEERDERVADVLSRVITVPTSAKDWVNHKRGKRMNFCRDVSETGIPRLREVISALAEHQIETTSDVLAKRIAKLRELTIGTLERSENVLGADIQGIIAAIQGSREQMQEVQDQHVQIVEDLRLSVLNRFQQVRETLSDKIRIAASLMREKGRKRVHGHLRDLHWKSLRATVDREGSWVTAGGRNVNLRDAMGGEMTQLVPQAWERVADERLEKHIAEARAGLLATLKSFTMEIRAIVDAGVADELSRLTVNQLFEASLERAESTIQKRVGRVTELLGRTGKDMQELVDTAVRLSIGSICESCSEDKGIGWRSRSEARIVEATSEVAEEAEKRCIAIADDVFDKLEKAVQAFCTTATTEMQKIGENIPSVLRNAVEVSLLKTPQAQRQLIQSTLKAAPGPFVDVSLDK